MLVYSEHIFFNIVGFNLQLLLVQRILINWNGSVGFNKTTIRYTTDITYIMSVYHRHDIHSFSNPSILLQVSYL